MHSQQKYSNAGPNLQKRVRTWVCGLRYVCVIACPYRTVAWLERAKAKAKGTFFFVDSVVSVRLYEWKLVGACGCRTSEWIWHRLLKSSLVRNPKRHIYIGCLHRSFPSLMPDSLVCLAVWCGSILWWPGRLWMWMRQARRSFWLPGPP